MFLNLIPHFWSNSCNVPDVRIKFMPHSEKLYTPRSISSENKFKRMINRKKGTCVGIHQREIGH